MGKSFNQCCVEMWWTWRLPLQRPFRTDAHDTWVPPAKVYPSRSLSHIPSWVWYGCCIINHHPAVLSPPLWWVPKARWQFGGSIPAIWLVVQGQPPCKCTWWIFQSIFWNGGVPKLRIRFWSWSLQCFLWGTHAIAICIWCKAPIPNQIQLVPIQDNSLPWWYSTMHVPGQVCI